MSRTESPSTAKPYGLARVTAAWGLPRSTYYARRHRLNHPVESRKRGPRTAWTDEVLTERIREQIAASPFSGEGHRKVWARLRVAGIRSSKARVLRLMRRAQLLAPQRQAVPVVEKTHSGTITTDRPNRMWGIDATATVTTTTARSPSSLPLTIARPSVWAFMPSSVPRASRLSNPSAKVSVNTSAASGPPPKDSDSGTITVRSS